MMMMTAMFRVLSSYHHARVHPIHLTSGSTSTEQLLTFGPFGPFGPLEPQANQPEPQIRL